MKKEKSISVIEPGALVRRIFIIRGRKVMIDDDLAELYEVDTKNLNKAVRRNPERFPEDFCFQITSQEAQTEVEAEEDISLTFLPNMASVCSQLYYGAKGQSK